MVWFVSGVKSVTLMDPAPGYRQLEVSGVYVWTESGPDGSHSIKAAFPVRTWAGDDAIPARPSSATVFDQSLSKGNKTNTAENI